MARAAALTLALASGGAAWALLMTLDFEGILLLGLIGLAGGLWTLAQPLPWDLRTAVAVFACLTLLGTTGLQMRRLAGSFRPFSVWTGLIQKDLVDLDSPVASEGEFLLDKPDRDVRRTLVHLDRYGMAVWKQRNVTLAELDDILPDPARGYVLVRAHMDGPFQHLGWLLEAAAKHGHSEVLVGVRKFARSVREADMLCAEESYESWPELELAVPLVAADGPRLRVVATDWRAGSWGPKGGESRGRMATGARYEMNGRSTDDLRELSRWMDDAPPRSIEADPAVPVKFVVAVQNQLRKAGHPPAALVLPDPPSKEIREAEVLPYPHDG